jgi:hypothetical protein
MGETCPCQCQPSTLQDGSCAHDCARKFLQGLQDAQAELAGTMQRLTIVQHDVLAAQNELVQLMTAHIHDIHKSRPQPEPAISEKRSGLSLDAGRRLVQTCELLELCLLNVPNEDILLAQRVNKQFKSTIDVFRDGSNRWDGLENQDQPHVCNQECPKRNTFVFRSQRETFGILLPGWPYETILLLNSGNNSVGTHGSDNPRTRRRLIFAV